MSQPSSQDSLGTQEIYSQGSFDEIWLTLGRTFSNPEKVVQGVLTEEIPTIIEYKDQPEPDNLEIIYEQRTLRSVPSHPQVSDIDYTPVRSNGHSPLINGNSHYTSITPLIPSAHVDAVNLPPILPNTNYPGDYKFSICFEPNSGPITKATPWVYQEEHHKLFVKMQCVCPILFKIQGNPPPGSVVRGILTYKRPEHYKDIVTRCPNHRNTCTDGHPYQDHVMRCENSATRYEVCPSTNRLSLVIPLKATNVVVGEGYFKELFKFTCFNSCVGGMNRRPTNLLFRLECGGKIYGRALVEVRICASPGRDCSDKETLNNQKNSKEIEKRNAEVSSSGDIVTAMPLSAVSCNTPTSPTVGNQRRASVLMSTRKDVSCVVQEPFQFPNVQINQKKRPCVATNGVVLSRAKRTCMANDVNDDELFTLVVKGRERYTMLLKIKDGLDLLDGIRVPDSNSSRYGHNVENRQIPEFTNIKSSPGSVQVKKEEEVKEQCKHQPDTESKSPQSSQESSGLNFSQLSRTSSNASSQCSQSGEEYSAWQVTLKRTLNLDTFAQSRSRSSS